MSSNLSERVENLKSEIFSFYNSIISSSLKHSKTRDYAESVYEHTGRVIDNMTYICPLMGCTPSDILYASAICYDMGRLSKKPEDYKSSDRDWRNYTANNHHTISARECIEPLKNAGFTVDEINQISSLIEYHGIDIGSDAHIDVKALQIADKLDKIGNDGAMRLYGIRFDVMKYSHEKSKSDTIGRMENTVVYLSGLGLPAKMNEYIKNKHDEGLEALENIDSSKLQ